MTHVKKFVGELKGNRVEGELIKTIFISLISSFAFLAIAYYFGLKNVNNLIPKYGFFLVLSIMSFALIVPAIRQVRAYKFFNCMSGMMIGMTIGMIAGFLPGFYIGATNGMFYGSVFGMFVGIALGFWNGKCCGIMGVMEGVMAGFMGGIMGAMTSVMLIADHLNLASIIVFLIAGVIMFSLNYMIFKETMEADRVHHEDQFFTIVMSIILTALTTWLMIFGPRGGVFI